MKKQKFIWIISLVILVFIVCFVAFSENKSAVSVRKAISISLEEDFKIKESLGKVFFAAKDEDSVSASTMVDIISLGSPGEECVLENILGEPCLKINSGKYSSVWATEDGVIESVSENRMTLRHYDGKLSEYKNVCAIKKEGEKVYKGDSIGYITGDAIYKLYENCKTLNPGDYIS